MPLLLLFLAAFPGERIANLPTGQLPEPGLWQINISHRFLPSVTAQGWGEDILQFLNGADVRDVIDRSLTERLTIGASLTVATRELGLHAAWAPLDWLTFYPEVSADIRQFAIERTWANIGIALHRSFSDRLALVGQSRLTTNTKQLYGSLGLGLKAAVLASWWLGIETEPVLVGRDTATTLVPWTLTIDRQQGWHNFVLTVGSSLRQSAPSWFRTYRNADAYDDIVDVTKGHFRVGFNILRKL